MNSRAYLVGFLALAAIAIGGTAAALYALQVKEGRDLEEVQRESKHFVGSRRSKQERAEARLAELAFWDFKQRVRRHNREIDEQRARRHARARS